VRTVSIYYQNENYSEMGKINKKRLQKIVPFGRNKNADYSAPKDTQCSD